MNKRKTEPNEALVGNLFAVAAYTLWGLLPLYWKMLKNVPAGEILAHRIFWSFVFVLGLALVQKRWGKMLEMLKDIKIVRRIALCTILISVNWGLYIWAVNSDHIVEASMGYYINPLIVILLSMIVLKERLSVWQGVSVGFATIGVAIMTIEYGKVPWVALSLALSFGLYGLFKKLVNAESIVGLGVETLLITPLALGYILFRQMTGVGALGVSATTTIFLLCSGFATATPLLWFASAARRIPLSTVGFYQYIAPTISLTLGVFLFKEQFTATHVISFGFIWTGLVIYTLSIVLKPRKMKTDIATSAGK